jgi:hypothetical protein
MNDLVAFLRERLDEDEETAHAAAAVCGCHPEAPSWSFGDEETDGRILVDGDPHPGVRRKIGRRWSGSYEGMFMAQHVVRHDPARVLCEVEAKREIAEQHRPVGNGNVCLSYCHTRTPSEAQTWPCLTLRLLALPYVDHPDYREEWRP